MLDLYDVLVVGSGASGGWACKRLAEAGLKVALVDAGRPQSDRNFVDHVPPFKLKYRNLAPEVIRRAGRPIQNGSVDGEYNFDWACNDFDEPYTTSPNMPFKWQGRMRITGGRSNVWGRHSYRFSDLDFKAASRDGYGVDWPLSYKDLAPYYDIVEEYVGISGSAEGVNELPDGKFQPPMAMTCVEALFRDRIKQKFGRTMTMGRAANITSTRPFRAARKTREKRHNSEQQQCTQHERGSIVMRRRNFLLGGITAASAFWPSFSSPLAAPAAFPSAPAPASELDHHTEDYARFCAMPESERVFYALHNGQIASERLNDQTWIADKWPRPPDLPVPGGSHDGVPMESPIPNLAGEGPYQPTWESLLQYECPGWYRDAKFGIWNHWSPQCVAEDGDWYARYMYVQGSKKYDFQLAHYGPPSRFGYKDLCAQWTLLNWQPAELMDLYVRAGARFFVALANHHDGFDAWNSRYHPWNSAAVGPHRDVIGTWAAEARQRQLHFGVTVHQAFNWNFFQIAHGADATGPMAGQPYDGQLTLADGRGRWWEGLDPQRLYGPKHPSDALPHVSYVKNFYDRTRDLVDQHNPDLLYFDTTLFPLGWAGMNMAAYYYNHSLSQNGGKMGGVTNVKRVPPNLAKSVVADYERGIADSILPYPWQSETCIGDWHYLRPLFDAPGEFGGYMDPREVIHWMIDTVSKNGTFLLNIPGKPDGTIDPKERLILERIGEWFNTNGEAIYATRPWVLYGEGPHLKVAANGKLTGSFGALDIRYTRNKAGSMVYAIALGWPEQTLLLRALGTTTSPQPAKVAHVELLGSRESLRWRQAAEGLSIEPPTQKPPSDYAVVFKLSLV